MSPSRRIALWGGREIADSVVATTPYAAYHFHRAAPYGALANLLAMPVGAGDAGGMIGMLLMPFGFDAPFWHLMGGGIDWVIAVAQ